MPATDRQDEKKDILTRIDEIDRWQLKVTDNGLKEEMQERKEALRSRLDTL